MGVAHHLVPYAWRIFLGSLDSCPAPVPTPAGSPSAAGVGRFQAAATRLDQGYVDSVLGRIRLEDQLSPRMRVSVATDHASSNVQEIDLQPPAVTLAKPE